MARHPGRPYSLDYINLIFSEFLEVHGDRLFADDPAVVTGFAKIKDKKIAIIAQQKGRNTKENLHRNFGMMKPEGYRKALRVMKLAEKFKLPVITFKNIFDQLKPVLFSISSLVVYAFLPFQPPKHSVPTEQWHVFFFDAVFLLRSRLRPTVLIPTVSPAIFY